MKQRILLYDIETTPIISYNWGRYDQTALAVQKDWELLSVAYKWLGKKEVHCITRAGEASDKKLTGKLWKLLNEADVVIAHNGAAFDNKKSAAKFLEHGLTPPKPFSTIDTLKIARKQFKLTSNRLNDLGKLLGVGEKVRTGGIDLWFDCMADKPSAWKKMIQYNKQDIVLLEKVYLKLRPWNTANINVASWINGLTCPKCASNNLKSNGFRRNALGLYRRFQCLDCGGWVRDRTVTVSQKTKLVND